MEEEREFYQRLSEKGVSRRDFMKYCGVLTATMGLSSSFIPKVAEVFAAPKQRPPVIWLQFAECTGCSEATIGTMYPWIDELILEILSMEYHETVVEGAIGTKYDGAYGKIGGRTFLEIGNEVCKKALAVICIGSCSSYGGIQAAAPNPGGYKGVGDALGIKTVNIPGCPPNPINLVGTIVNFLLLGKLPACDKLGRPLFAYGKSIHDQCPRRSHYENDEFVEQFGSEEAAMGYCLYKMGCKGPDTYNNCPIAKFNDGTSWPVEAGHPCIGCSEPGFWDKMTPFFEESK